MLALVARAVAARVSLIQIREKDLQVRVLCALVESAVRLTAGSATSLVVNDRADVARSAGADGVHLTARSLKADVVRRMFGPSWLIGVSAHSLDEARAARDEGADFATLGPVYRTQSKIAYGPPIGLPAFAEAASVLNPFPLVALGGISPENLETIPPAGASGVAAIRLFDEAEDLPRMVQSINASFRANAARE
ncbi:MAG TPA: thiamine phosphate synthase [Pyrinomonadaceae bacterium]|nr:thiamine phosphate synthase [Pyrinomonadaceae bacterium]